MTAPAWTPALEAGARAQLEERHDLYLAAALAEIERLGAELEESTIVHSPQQLESIVADRDAAYEHLASADACLLEFHGVVDELAARNEVLEQALRKAKPIVDMAAGQAGRRINTLDAEAAADAIESALATLGSEHMSPAGWEDRVREAVAAERSSGLLIAERLAALAVDEERERIRLAVEALALLQQERDATWDVCPECNVTPLQDVQDVCNSCIARIREVYP